MARGGLSKPAKDILKANQGNPNLPADPFGLLELAAAGVIINSYKQARELSYCRLFPLPKLWSQGQECGGWGCPAAHTSAGLH